MGDQDMQTAQVAKRIFDFTIKPEFILALVLALGAGGAWGLRIAIDQQGDMREMHIEIRDTLNSVQDLAKRVDGNRADADATKSRVETLEKMLGMTNLNIENLIDSVKSLRETVSIGFSRSAEQISDLSKAQAATHEAVAIQQMRIERGAPGPHGG